MITPNEAARFVELHKCETENCTNPKALDYGARLCSECDSNKWRIRANVAGKIVAAFERFADVRKFGEPREKRAFEALGDVDVVDKPVVGLYVSDKYERVKFFAKRKGFNGTITVWQYELVFESEAAVYTFREAAEQAFPQLKEDWT